MPSSAPAAKAGLLALLAARPALSTVQRSWGHPGELIEKESVLLLGVQSSEQPAQLGQLARDETYSLTVAVCVHQDGDDAQAVEQRAWALAAEVEAAVHDDRTLSGALTGWAGVTAMAQDAFIESGGRTAEVVLTIECRHRK